MKSDLWERSHRKKKQETLLEYVHHTGFSWREWQKEQRFIRQFIRQFHKCNVTISHGSVTVSPFVQYQELNGIQPWYIIIYTCTFRIVTSQKVNSYQVPPQNILVFILCSDQNNWTIVPYVALWTSFPPKKYSITRHCVGMIIRGLRHIKWNEAYMMSLSLLVSWHTVWVLEECLCVCARLWGTEPYREAGENRVYMDPSWPLKEREKRAGQSLLDYYWSLVTDCPSRYTDTGKRQTDFQLNTATKWRAFDELLLQQRSCYG